MRKQWTKEELIAFEDRVGDLYMDCLLYTSPSPRD